MTVSPVPAPAPLPAPTPPAGYRPASLGRRTAGRVVDFLIGGTVGGLIGFLLTLGVDPYYEMDVYLQRVVIMYVIGFVLAAGVYVYLGMTGYLPGGRLVGVRQVRMNNGGPPGWRGIGKYLLVSVIAGFTFGIGYLVIVILLAKDPLRRGWHDKVSGLIVVDTTRPATRPGFENATDADTFVPQRDLSQPQQSGVTPGVVGVQFTGPAVDPASPALAPPSPADYPGHPGLPNPANQDLSHQDISNQPFSNQDFSNQPFSNHDFSNQGRPLIADVPWAVSAPATSAPPSFEPASLEPAPSEPASFEPAPSQPASFEPPPALPAAVVEPAVVSEPPAPFDDRTMAVERPVGWPDAQPVTQPVQPGTLSPIAIVLDDGQRISGTVIALGRNPSPPPQYPDAVLARVNDPAMSVSKTHLVVGRDAEGMFALDLHSTNGSATRSNGQQTPLPPGQRVPLAPGTRIDFGQCSLRIEF